jgi:hypothetical protein
MFVELETMIAPIKPCALARLRAIRIIVSFIPQAGCDLPATFRLLADFSRTRFDRWGARCAFIRGRDVSVRQ